MDPPQLLNPAFRDGPRIFKKKSVSSGTIRHALLLFRGTKKLAAHNRFFFGRSFSQTLGEQIELKLDVPTKNVPMSAERSDNYITTYL